MTVIEIVHGSKFAFEYSIENRYSEVSLTGVGKMTFGRINAHFVLDTGDVELEADLKNGVFNSRKMSGEITINLEDWFDELNLITDDNEDVIEDMVLTVKSIILPHNILNNNILYHFAHQVSLNGLSSKHYKINLRLCL